MKTPCLDRQWGKKDIKHTWTCKTPSASCLFMARSENVFFFAVVLVGKYTRVRPRGRYRGRPEIRGQRRRSRTILESETPQWLFKEPFTADGWVLYRCSSEKGDGPLVVVLYRAFRARPGPDQEISWVDVSFTGSIPGTVHQHITTHTERGREKRGRGGISIGGILDCELLLEYTSHILSRETVAQASQAQRAMCKAEIALI